MGNQVTRSVNISTKKTDSIVTSNPDSTDSVSQSTSKTDNEHTGHMQFFPIDSLAKTLAHLTYEEERVNGITSTVFQKYLFPNYLELGERLFMHLHYLSEVTTHHLSIHAFKQQAEKLLAVMNDQAILESYLRMYSSVKKEADIMPEVLRSLLMTCYQLAKDSSGTTTCIHVHQIINAVVLSCFHGKDRLSVSYVSHWIGQHCPRIIQVLHRYVVHVLTTAYRNGKALMSKEQPQPPLEIPTPILERSDSLDQPQSLLPSSYVWLLCSTLPECYLRTNNHPKDLNHALLARTFGIICPRHWTLLYNSSEHGAGANRFLHHILGYKGPTLLFIKAASQDNSNESRTYCLCSAVEWRESHLYWGDEDSIAIELLPSYKVIEKGAKVLYLNTGIRGYPHGLRFGSDPRSPYISIDEAFHTVTIAGAPYLIGRLEMWGCGDPKLRERQLEIKKWQVKEAEKQRIVKLSASDWLDHPDRYLLELAGRACYNESNN